MGLLDRLIIQDELRSREARGEMPMESKGARNTILPDRDDRLAAARGVVVGTVLGMIVWAVILWGSSGRS